MQKKYYNPLMETEALVVSENPQKGILEEKAESFIEGMRKIKFDGPRGKFSLDTFVLLTYNQETKKDEIEIISWAVDSSRSSSDYMKVLLSVLSLPKGKDHLPYPQTTLQRYDDMMLQDGKRIPVIAFGVGSLKNTRRTSEGDGSFLFRREGMHTKESFERLRRAVGLR
jgi:hypothetical protein